MEEKIIWVNEKDDEIGYGEKIKTHEKAILHRAFSLFIYNQLDDTLLIHKRASCKYHSGGLWTNSCCSHPRKDETLLQAVERRMIEELGCSTHDLRFDDKPISIVELGKFQYFQEYTTCSENEIDHVFGIIISQSQPLLFYNLDEIEEIKWITISELYQWFEASPQEFTAWFGRAYEIFYRYIQENYH